MAKGGAMSITELMENSRLYRMRRVVRLIPRAPRCKLCNVPFAGPGRIFKLVGYGRSRKNPNMCTACFERAPVGGAEARARRFVRGRPELHLACGERVT
jgi:hypothetical protein